MFVLTALRFIGRHAIPAAVALAAAVAMFVAADAASATAAETATVYVIGTYEVTGGELTVWSDGTAQFEPYTVSPCDGIDWRMTRDDGSPLIPFDENRDGFISCTSDFELGA